MWVYIILVTVLVIIFLYHWDNNFHEYFSPTLPKAPPIITLPKAPPPPVVTTLPITTAPKTTAPPVTTAPKTTVPPLTTVPVTTTPKIADPPVPIVTIAQPIPTAAKTIPQAVITAPLPTVAKATPPVAKATPPVAKATPSAKVVPTPTKSKITPTQTKTASTTPKTLFRYGNLQVKPSTETYCMAGMYGGDLDTCTNSTALFTEANLLDSKIPSFPQTKSTIKVGYLQMGTANPEYITFDPLKYKSSGKVFNKNLDRIAFNYNNVRNLPEIEKTLKTRIDYISSKGANAIRFDEIDTCANDICNQDNFNQVLINVANYAAMNKKLLLLGNNGRYYSDPDIVTSAEALVNSKLPIAGWTIEQFPDTVKGIREIVGARTPIFGLAATGDEAYTLSNVKDDSGVVMIDGISIYKY